jgi:uncharacterized membrane protein YqaE (UPF0057 family)
LWFIGRVSQLDSKIHPVVLIFFAIFLPPVAVFLKTRDWLHTIINLVLCCLYVFPGIFHALFFVLRR